jgi:hypothetical protein
MLAQRPVPYHNMHVDTYVNVHVHKHDAQVDSIHLVYEFFL